MRKNLLVVVCIINFPSAFACSFAPGYELFNPELDRFEPKFDEDYLMALLPAPDSVEVTSVVRGTAAPGSSCDDAGILQLQVAWPSDSIYRIDEIGFYFRADVNMLSERIFPRMPIAPIRYDGNNAVFTFVWLDGHPSKQKPLDFDIEVFAVNEGLQIGVGKTIRVSD